MLPSYATVIEGFERSYTVVCVHSIDDGIDTDGLLKTIRMVSLFGRLLFYHLLLGVVLSIFPPFCLDGNHIIINNACEATSTVNTSNCTIIGLTIVVVIGFFPHLTTHIVIFTEDPETTYFLNIIEHNSLVVYDSNRPAPK